MDIKGLKLFIINDDILKDSEQLRSFITEHKIKKLYLPSLLLKIHNQISINSKIKYILTGVEYLQAYRLKDGQLYIAKSTVPINIRWSRQLEGKHSSITIAKDCA
ncbi:MAG: hypothetical protein RLZZ293_429, partial [Pseudomonadota bacterium]